MQVFWDPNSQVPGVDCHQDNPDLALEGKVLQDHSNRDFRHLNKILLAMAEEYLLVVILGHLASSKVCLGSLDSMVHLVNLGMAEEDQLGHNLLLSIIWVLGQVPMDHQDQDHRLGFLPIMLVAHRHQGALDLVIAWDLIKAQEWVVLQV